MHAVHLRLESLENPIGIDEVQPRFSWQVAADGFDAVQGAYQIQVSDENGLVWDSEKVNSDSSRSNNSSNYKRNCSSKTYCSNTNDNKNYRRNNKNNDYT